MANTQIDSNSTRRKGIGAKRPHEKGFALLLATLSLLFLVPLAGLAIDAGMAYIIKTRLSVAVDSACLSAARSLNRGLTLAEQRDAARGVALRYFNANFPQDHFGTTGIAPIVDINETQVRMRTVTVNATRRAPLYFMPILGEHYADVNVIGQATRRDSNVIMVLDRSGSMQINNSVTPMKNAAVKFAQSFANGTDQLGLVVFNGGATRAMEPTQNFLSTSPSITSKINSIGAAGATNQTAALNAAYDMLITINQPGAVNAIVFFTDGIANGVTANFNNRNDNGELDLIQSGSTCSYKDNDRIGVIAYGGHPNTTSTNSWGLYKHTSTSLTAGDSAISYLNGCAMASDLSDVRYDIARIPYKDYWGNRTAGFLGAKSVTYTNVSSPRNLANASMNTVADQANKIRANATLQPVIYSIGLAPETGNYAIEDEFMKQVANAPDSAYFNSSQQIGMYIYVPLTQQNDGLQEAFDRIAAEILRLSL